MNKIQSNGASLTSHAPSQPVTKSAKKDTKFSDVLSGVADVALVATATVAPLVPGGQLLGLAAGGIYGIKQAVGSKGDQGPSGGEIDKMWAMQRENQAHNMQYMQLQQQIQSDNRSFSTLSNLMKVRHDTAKSAINNMHA